jgi:MacB-like periplasmic core domain
MENRMMLRLSRFALRVIAHVVPPLERSPWLREWEAELDTRRLNLARRNALTPRQEFDMFRRVLGSFHDATWLRRQFTRDADLVHDMRYGARLLRRNPGFALLTVAVLALGMGATTGIYSVIDALLVRQLPYRNPERIVLLFETPMANRTAIEGVAPGNFIDWKTQIRALEHLTAVEPFGFTYTGGDEPQTMPGMRVSSGFFESFGMDALHGRTFTPDEYTAGRNLVAVLSHGTWTERFGADRGIVGRVMRLNGQPHTIVGVMPPAFAPRLLSTFAERGVWTPKVWAEFEQRLRGARFYNAVAKLKPGVTIEQAQSELDGIAQRLAQAYPRTNSAHTIQLVSLRDHLAGDLRPSIGLLLGAAVLLLFIAMANTSGTTTARPGRLRCGRSGARAHAAHRWRSFAPQLYTAARDEPGVFTSGSGRFADLPDAERRYSGSACRVAAAGDRSHAQRPWGSRGRRRVGNPVSQYHRWRLQRPHHRRTSGAGQR